MPGMGESRDKVVPPEITKEQIHEFIDLFAEYCYKLKCVGFDMVNIYASYNASILAKSLSPILNQRTDEYGGSVENRARLLLELLQKIKEVCGRDYPIEVQISGEETLKGGYTTEDFVAYCKILEPYVDIFQIRAKSGDLTHVNAYFAEKETPPNLRYCKLLKDAGIRSYIAPVGGFQDPDVMERVLAEGTCDLIAQARALICEEDYWTKILEERRDDIITCLGCDKCHRGVCAINPRIGNPGWKDMVQPPTKIKRVAVIGGGPAGLKAACTAAERGHQVDLYEKSDRLGGQLVHSDYISRKWSLRGFKDYLVRMCQKQGVHILLNTDATPERIDAGNYDAVIAAPGSRSKVDAVPVAPDAAPLGVLDLFGKEAQLGHHVVLVGGSMTAVDAALYLQETGHQVTILTRHNEAGYDYDRHSRDGFFAMWRSLENITTIPFAQATLIAADGVEYETKSGETQKVLCDSVVLSEGRIPLVEEAQKFMAPGRQFYVVGDACQLTDTTSAGLPMAPPGMPTPPHENPNKDTTENGIRHSQLTAFWAANSL
jgi:thioredoxin reductase